MNQNNLQLFVYSSLRHGFHNPAYNYITQYFSFVCHGKIKGILSDLGEFPVGTPTTQNSFIEGELYAIKKDDEFSWVIGQLDDYEDVNAEEDKTPLFRRELTEVFLDKNESTYAWVYWYTEDVTGKPIIASGDVTEYFREKNKQ